mmetsp:Transcript_8764/g.11563  ORF Transcript_8764/g.11563 Transcript_8764/m.11563 type:complete len:455 (-) Transcript_8764:97-1461(-)
MVFFGNLNKLKWPKRSMYQNQRIAVPFALVCMSLKTCTGDVSPCACESIPIMQHSFDASSLSFPEVPPNLKLQQCIVITRHGDRVPISRSLGKSLPECTKRERSWKALLPKNQDLHPRNVVNPVYKQSCGSFKPRDHGQEPYAQLTIRGMKQHESLGEYLRKHFLKNGLLSHNLNPEEIYARSTNLQRTIQSAQSLLYGLYPPSSRAPGKAGIVQLNVWPIAEEILIPNANRKCQRQYEIIKELQRAGDIPEDLQASGFEEECKSVLGLDDNLNWAQVLEVLLCHEIHGIPQPKGVTPTFLEKTYRASIGRWTKWFQHPEFNRLAIGPFLNEICAKMKEAVSGDSSYPRFVLFSAHDNTLVPVLCALGCFDGQLPPYASVLCFEVAQNILDGKHLVRITYNNKEMNAYQKSEKWLPFKEFAENLMRSVPANYKDECSITASKKNLDCVESTKQR